jgi:hypothetical protein
VPSLISTTPLCECYSCLGKTGAPPCLNIHLTVYQAKIREQIYSLNALVRYMNFREGLRLAASWLEIGRGEYPFRLQRTRIPLGVTKRTLALSQCRSPVKKIWVPHLNCGSKSLLGLCGYAVNFFCWSLAQMQGPRLHRKCSCPVRRFGAPRQPEAVRLTET